MKFTTLAAFVAVVAALDPPKSAKKDLGADAESKAAQEMTSFYNLVTENEKTAGGYAKADAAGKAKIDAAIKVKIDAMKKEATDMKTLVKYDAMTTEQKTLYNAEALKYVKANYNDCKGGKKTVDCLKAADIRKARETARVTGKYY